MGLKDVKKNFLIDIATDLFICRSIQEVTIKDIAISAQVGEATIYRYFGKKQTLVVESAMKLQKEVDAESFKLDEGKNGFEKLKIFYLSYLQIFDSHPEFFKFINEFDAYMAGEQVDELDTYESVVGQYKTTFMHAYELGIKDGSVKAQNNVEMFYYSTTHALLELCKKLSIKGAVLSQDNVIEKRAQIQCLVDIILSALN